MDWRNSGQGFSNGEFDMKGSSKSAEAKRHCRSICFASPFSARLGVILLAVQALFVSVQEAYCQVTYRQLRSFGYPDQGGSDPSAALLVGRDGMLYGTASSGGALGGGAIFRINQDGTGYTVLRSFGSPSGDGTSPQRALIQGSDGVLYGSTSSGGTNGGGIIFRIGTDGSGYQVLHNFNGFSGDGSNPGGPLLQGPDGILYGATWYGGSSGGGTVFRVDTHGSGYAILMSFQPGMNAYGIPVNQDPVGLTTSNGITLYGTTVNGGASNAGTVFSISTNGSSYTILHSFSGTNGEVAPNELTLSSDGMLYGTTSGRGQFGTVFAMSLDGSGYTVLHRFDPTGGGPVGKLVLGLDGTLYGLITGGGSGDCGTCFTIKRNGTGYAVLLQVDNPPYSPVGLAQGPDATLYGTANGGGFGTLFKLNTDGSNYSIMRYFFTTGGGDGANPRGPLVWGNDGFLYGTSYSGGSNALGMVFRMSSDAGTYSVLHTFTHAGADGRNPNTLLQGTDGMLYGATYRGGTNGYGTLFKVSKQGTGYMVLWHFAIRDIWTVAGFLQGSDGLLYGTTLAGTLFSIHTDGSGYTVLHSFGAGLDGKGPSRALIQGADGWLYGMTTDGGAGGLGTIFKVNTNGDGYVVLRNFGLYASEGYAPVSLIQCSDGALYGATYRGGSGDSGALFRMNTDGTGLSVLWSFSLASSNARYLFERSVQGADGAIYAATQGGGSSDNGTVFSIQTNGTGFSILHSFGDGSSDGTQPFSPICQGSDGAFYGMAQYGGAMGLGTVFAIGYPPIVISPPTSIRVPYGAGATFHVTASGAGLRYQWLFNTAPIPGETNATLFLPSVGRTNEGLYCVGITNGLGGVLSSNAFLSVLVAQELFGPVFQPDGFEVSSRYADGWPVSSQDLTNFEVQTSSDLLHWTALPNTLTLTNGVLLLRDTNSLNSPARFYRLLER
ncbi:MAG: hypothetical protein C5B50_11385 [Verrucomicrobia bacterium]|nr:MAG: hypothetical protein C5B50_11385 [Verrucomicrobiota bacterium]